MQFITKLLVPLMLLMALSACGGGGGDEPANNNQVAQNTYFRDADSDGYGDPAVSTASQKAGYVQNSTDCDDDNRDINPGAVETCNAVDDNCSGAIDEGVQTTYYADADGDGFGSPTVSVQACMAPSVLYVSDNTDCDDGSGAVHPGVVETCNTIDDDCDGTADNGLALSTYYADADGDGFGSPTVSVQACMAPSVLYVLDNTDCNDGSGAVHPGVVETCNTIDDDCDGTADNGLALSTYYADADGDGFGSPTPTSQACATPAGYVANSTDCDGANAAINPNATEICNSIDDNCNGQIDAGEAGVACETIPPAPEGVSATDITPGLTVINVTWSASSYADHYVVYRAVMEEGVDYEPVSGEVTGTSYTYTENWEDTYNQIGPLPAMLLTSDTAASATFINNFDAYMAQAVPMLLNFKAPAFFKVQACNELGCSDLSAADEGQAGLTHTQTSSEVTELLAPVLVYPAMRALASAPRGQAALGWCGMDLCGPSGGMVMGRIDIAGIFTGTLPQIDIHFENFTSGTAEHPGATLNLDGYAGGMQSAANALAGILEVSGDFTFWLADGTAADVFAYIKVDGSIGQNTGYVSVTYNGNTYQFNLPVQPTNGQAVGVAGPVAAVSSAQVDTSMAVAVRTTAYPTPFFTTAPVAGCGTNEPVLVKSCTRIE